MSPRLKLAGLDASAIVHSGQTDIAADVLIEADVRIACESLVLGAGYRVTSSLRGGAGVLVFQQADPNPLVTQKSAAATWYASFSLDLDILRGVAR